MRNLNQIKKMRLLGKIHRKILTSVTDKVVSGMTTQQVDDLCKFYMDKHDVRSSCFQYKGFPGYCCVSVNEVACHGVPNSRVIREGDMVNVDIVINDNSVHTDASHMVLVGKCDADSVRLVESAKKCMLAGISKALPGNNLLDIAVAIEKAAHSCGYRVNDTFCGHGIGKKMHQLPDVHCSVPNNVYELESLRNFVLKPGMTFTVEPIIMDGEVDVLTLEDNWTVVSKDGKRSAQWEHTILITDSGNEILA